MHEVALARGLLDVVEDTARSHAVEVVSSVTVQVGALAHVDPDALLQAFTVARPGTVAEAAELVIHRTPAEALCVPCGQLFTVTDRAHPCPQCGRHQWLLSAGEELKLVEIQVHDDHPPPE